MKDWYKFETGNESRKEALLRFLRRNKLTHELIDRSAEERCDWWRVKILITNNTQLTNINNWLKAN